MSINSHEEPAITYFPDNENDFNGILIILREPHKSSDDNVSEGNREWFKKLSNGETGKRYQNRFNEMIGICKKRETELKNVAFTNINLKGGGATASKEYKDLTKKDKEKRVNEIINEVRGKMGDNYKKLNIFLIWDAFDACFNGTAYKPADSEKYEYRSNNGNNKRLKYCDCTDKNIRFYRIYHPSRSPKIVKKEG